MSPVLGGSGTAAGGLYGKFSARPAASAANYGKTYFATDRGLTYVSTPAGWRVLADDWQGTRGITRTKLIDDMNDSSLWSFTNSTTGTLGTTTDPEVTGRNVMTLTTPSGSVSSIARDVALDMRSRSILLRINPDANVTRINIQLMAGTRTFANRFESDSINIGLAPLYPTGKWSEVAIPLGDFAAQGTGSVANIKDVRQVGLQVVPNTGTVAVCGFSQLRVMDDPLPPGVIFTFDDNRLDNYTDAYPILAAAGMVGHIYVANNFVGGTVETGVPGMSLAQLQALVAAGWSMGGHSQTHSNMAGLTLANLRLELQANMDYLVTNNLIDGAGAHFAYPFGGVNAQVDAETLKWFTTARSVSGRVAHSARAGTRGALGCIDIQSTGSNITQAQAKLDRIAAQGGIAVIMGHSVNNASASVNTTTADFTTIVNKVQALGLKTYHFNEVFPV